MRKSKQIRFYINDEVYQSDIMVFVGGTIEQAINYINKKYDLDLQRQAPTTHTYASVIVNKAFKGCAVWFKHPKPPGRVVAHEVLHIAHHILGGSGLTLTDESEEAYAYYIDWLTKKIGNKVW